MSKDNMKDKKKFKVIAWAFGYFAIVVSMLISACIIFHNNYYTSMYVEGTSMTPTLNKDGKTEFGIVDSITKSKNFIKRFDIVTTYYPVQYNGSSDYCFLDEFGNEVKTTYKDPNHNVQLSSKADYKIKRVIALPGEQFTVTSNGVNVREKDGDTWGEWVTYSFDFNIKNTSNNKINSTPITLEEDEYWVIGDNWDNSIDSPAINHAIYKGNIHGVLIAIEGTCKTSLVNGKVKVSNKKYYLNARYYKR